ncbi:MAG: hypothetical protein K2Q12_00475 [Rickettsiales bacterium]|nr:hypothetical protein [Rickettsiales bacterium]
MTEEITAAAPEKMDDGKTPLAHTSRRAQLQKQLRANLTRRKKQGASTKSSS